MHSCLFLWPMFFWTWIYIYMMKIDKMIKLLNTSFEEREIAIRLQVSKDCVKFISFLFQVESHASELCEV